MGQPRDIRSKAIATAIKDGALKIIAPGERDDKSPGFYKVDEAVALGNGASRLVPTYYLNQAGAVLVLGRLNTPTAIAATVAVCTVFAALMRGEVAVAPTGLDRLAALMERQMAATDARMDRLEGLFGKLLTPRRATRPKPPVQATATLPLFAPAIAPNLPAASLLLRRLAGRLGSFLRLRGRRGRLERRRVLVDRDRGLGRAGLAPHELAEPARQRRVPRRGPAALRQLLDGALLAQRDSEADLLARPVGGVLRFAHSVAA